MLDSFLARLEEVGEVCHAEGVQIRILGGDDSLTARVGSIALQTLSGLEAV
jgi:hypothetical protein